MKYESILKEVSEELNLPYNTIKEIYMLYWKAMLDHLRTLPLKDNITEEQFNALKTSINIPRIGKFYITYKDYLHLQEIFKNVKHKSD